MWRLVLHLSCKLSLIGNIKANYTPVGRLKYQVIYKACLTFWWKLLNKYLPLTNDINCVSTPPTEYKVKSLEMTTTKVGRKKILVQRMKKNTYYNDDMYSVAKLQKRVFISRCHHIVLTSLYQLKSFWKLSLQPDLNKCVIILLITFSHFFFGRKGRRV